MKKRQWIIGLAALGAIAALILWGRGRIHFDFAVFGEQLARANWQRIAVGVLCIYAGYIFRAARWARLMRHQRKVPLLSLTGAQVMGFTAVALIGRVADPVRAYLVTRRTRQPLSSQIGIYIVERLFDFGSLAVILSVALLSIPNPETATGHADLLARLMAPLVRRYPEMTGFLTHFGALVITVIAIVILVLLRVSGEAVASILERSIGSVSRGMGQSIGRKVRAFHSGLGAIQSIADFGIAAALSLAMWWLIALAYIETAHAFTASPALAAMSIPMCILLLAVSGGVSVVQLPVLGWFSQIALVAAALSSFFGASPEAATACAATLLLVTFLSIIPVGLIWAQFENVSLRKLTAESGQAGNAADVEHGAKAGVDASAAS